MAKKNREKNYDFSSIGFSKPSHENFSNRDQIKSFKLNRDFQIEWTDQLI